MQLDMDIQRLEDFPTYISCIRNYGRPILPPLLSSIEREKMARIRHEAVIAETRIARRAIQPSLMMRVKEVMENIEKSEINLLKNNPVCANNDGSLDLVDLSASEVVLHLPMHSDMPYDNQQQIDLNTNKSDYEKTPSISHGGETREDPFGSDSIGFIYEKNAVCGDLTEQDDLHQCNKSADFIDCVSSAQPAVVVAASSPKQKLPAYFQESLKSNSDNSNISKMHGPVEKAISEANNVLQEPKTSNGDEVEKAISEANNVLQEPKTSDGDEVESESITTVILKSQVDNHNDTDSDSIVTSLAHSTDLEKYFDSPGENGHFSESSVPTDYERGTVCIMNSFSSDFQSSETLVNADMKTPVFSGEFVREESYSDQCTRSSSDLLLTPVVDDGASKAKIETSAYRKHVRRSSYTLEEPSPALIQAYASFNGKKDFENQCVSPHYQFVLAGDSLSSKNDALQISLPDTSSEDLSEVNLEAGDSVHVRPTTLHTKVLENQNGWAYKVVHSFPETPELAISEVPSSHSSCDIIRNSSRALLGYEPFSNSVLTPDTPTDVPRHFTPAYNELSESDLETSGANDYAKNFCESSEWMLSEKPLLNTDSTVASNILENIQNFDKQKLEQLIKDQRKQWERMQMEFRDQEWLLLQRLQCLSCSEPSVTEDKFARKADFKIPDAEKDVIEEPLPLKSPEVAKYHQLMQTRLRKRILCNEDLDPLMKAKFDRVSATVKAYLTRRLMKTERVQGVIQTIKDTLICAVKFHEETPVKKGEITEQDAELHQRFIVQLTAACYELHDIFFKLSAKEKMMIISQSREISKERKNENPNVSLLFDKDVTLSRPLKSRNKPMLSSATVKVLERKKARSSTVDKNVSSFDRKCVNRNLKRCAQERSRSVPNHNLHISSPSSMLRNARPITPVKRNMLGRSPPKLLKSARRLVYRKADAYSTNRLFNLNGPNEK